MIGPDSPGEKKWKLFDMDQIHQQYAEFAKEEKEKLLIKRYSELGEWIATIRAVCSRANKPLEQALQEALADNRTLTGAPQRFKPQDGESYIRCTTSRERAREPDYKTLLQMVRTGPDQLRFFIMLCPHAREAFMKGQLPPFPWRKQAADIEGTKLRMGSLREWAGGERMAMAIVFTDTVGSTALRNKIGDESMNEMIERHFEQGRQLIENSEGREIKTTGDGFLAVFRSTDKALDFAIALHADTGDSHITIRAGIHLGEVTVQDNDIDGTAVHFASRIIGVIKEPEIWLSNEAHQAIETHRANRHSHLQWEPHNGIEMKGFTDTATLWSLAHRAHR